jgi:hypothetical protein
MNVHVSAIRISDVSVVISALFNTETDRVHSNKKTTVFRKPAKTGRSLIVLTFVSTVTAIRIKRADESDKQSPVLRPEGRCS